MFNLRYILMLLAQPVSFAAITGIVLLVKRKRYILYSYLIHLLYIAVVEVFRSYAGDRVYAVAFVFFNLTEVVLPLIFARYFVRNLTWKAAFYYLFLGTADNMIYQSLIVRTGAGRAAFEAYLDCRWSEIALSGALLNVLVMLLVYFTVALLGRFSARKAVEAMERYYRPIYIVLSALLVAGNVIMRTSRDYADNHPEFFWTILVPVVDILAIAGLLLFFISFGKEGLKDICEKLRRVEKSERGDSNKEIRIFNEDWINRYFQHRTDELKRKGLAVEIISYMPCRISVSLEESRWMPCFEDVLLSLREKRTVYFVMVFRPLGDSIVINMEYGDGSFHRRNMLNRDHLTVFRDHYLYEQQERGHGSVTLLLPCKVAEKSADYAEMMI